MFESLCWRPRRHRRKTEVLPVVDPANSQTEYIATLNLERNQPLQLEDLPEELLDDIVAYLASDPCNTAPILHDLLAISLVSHKLHRITEPYLYRSVCITLNKREKSLKVLVSRTNGNIRAYNIDISTTKGCNAQAFFRTISTRPDLAKHVKYLRLARQDLGCRGRTILGFNGYERNSHATFSLEDIEHAAQSNTPFQHSTLMQKRPLPLTVSRDTATVAVCNILRILPNVAYLDGSGYHTDSPWDQLSEILAGLGNVLTSRHNFTYLAEVKLECNQRPLGYFWPLFTISQLKSLTLYGGLNSVIRTQLSSRWQSIQTCNIKQLVLPDLLIWSARTDETNALAHIARICANLESLRITFTFEAVELTWTRNYLTPFRQHLSKLHHLEMFDKTPQLSIHGVRAANQRDPREMRALRSSDTLISLSIDIVDLLRAFEADEICRSTTRGLIRQSYTYDSSSPRYYVVVDLTLPRSLVSLTLRIGTEHFVHPAVLDALEALAEDIRSPFPVLKHLTLWWHKSESYMCLQEFRLEQKLHKQGVELHSQYAQSED
ncbi:hypothetical protein BKA66DRAFT_437525 [Pyrenochaeta sp. MPI-SDFR-AT-0127]|nr:hypothetical protein BKA66DRAFT_437525 [Pyrenochaeta sp. MPI-SDFR-AT-0127]